MIAHFERGFNMENSTDFIDICPNCGSTQCLENYPVPGKCICVKCGHESIRTKLLMGETNVCHSCGEEVDKDTVLQNEDILILKCKKCGRSESYTYPSDFEGFYYDEPTDNSYNSLTVKIAEQEGKSIHSAPKYHEYAKALRTTERERRPIEKCKKQLDNLIRSKSDEIGNTGISSETIKLVRRRIREFLEERGHVTRKQLNSIFAATLSLIQRTDQIRYKRSLEKRVTDVQLENIFNVTRKTIREWRKTLQENSFFLIHLRLEVSSHLVEGQTRYDIVDIPDEVDFLVRLEKPREDKCDFCEKAKLLSWRLQFVDGSWSDICEESKTFIEGYLRESQIF